MRDIHTCDQAGLLRFLWDKFDVKSATDEELDYLASSIDSATTAARFASAQLADMAMHIHDAQSSGREVTKFDGIDFPVALTNLSQVMRMIDELTFIGSESTFEERKRAEANRKSPRVERTKHSERGKNENKD